eukprot:11679950-Ditylum_brightwellii.AAC.1
MEDLVQQDTTLPPLEIEHFFMSKEEVKLAPKESSMCNVYVDNFFLAGKPATTDDLQKWAHAAIWAILS